MTARTRFFPLFPRLSLSLYFSSSTTFADWKGCMGTCGNVGLYIYSIIQTIMFRRQFHGWREPKDWLWFITLIMTRKIEKRQGDLEATLSWVSCSAAIKRSTRDIVLTFNRLYDVGRERVVYICPSIDLWDNRTCCFKAASNLFSYKW